jgi:hypothetical protein
VEEEEEEEEEGNSTVRRMQAKRLTGTNIFLFVRQKV